MRPNHAHYKEKVNRRRKILIFAMLLIFFTIIAHALFGESGILVNMQVQAEHRKLQEEQQALRETNRRLREEIRALKTNPRKIEALGRSEYGFSRPGEVVFIFPDDPAEPVKKVEPVSAEVQ